MFLLQSYRFVTSESDTDIFGSGGVEMASGRRKAEARQTSWPLELDRFSPTVGEGKCNLSALSHSKITKIKAVFMRC